MRKPRPGTILLALWGIFLTISAYAYLTWLQPARLGGTVSRGLCSALDVQCSIGEISLSFFPRPALDFHDLSLSRGSMDNIELYVRHARAEMSWFSLLRLRPIVTRLSLDGPTLDVSGQITDKLLAGEQKPEALPPASFKLPAVHPSIIGTHFSIHEGLCRLSTADGRSALVLSGIESTARLPGLFPGHLELRLASVHCALASGIDITASDTALSIPTLKKRLSGLWTSTVQCSTSLQMGALDAAIGHKISAPYRYFPLAKPVNLTLEGSFDIDPEQGLYLGKGTTAASAVMTMNGHNVPMSFNIPFSLSGLDVPIQIQQADVRMEDDRLTLSGSLFGLPQGKPTLRGRADIHHFSLTRWFGFGRAMTGGLQYALDNITGSFDDFELSLLGIVVPRLTAKVLNMEFSGSGSCAEFLKPDIRIDARTNHADLDAVFPELHGTAPDMSHLPPPVLPLSPSDETAQDDSSTTCGYDIHLMADKSAILKFTPAKVDVHIVPAPTSGTMLKISADDLYKGKAGAEVYLQDKVRVTAVLNGVSAAEPATVLAGYPALSSTLKQGKADLTFLPGDLTHILASLEGSVQASFAQGTMRTKESRQPLAFRSFSVQANAAAVPPKNLSAKPPVMDFKGTWSAALETERWKVEAKAPKATIAFSTENGLPASMNRQKLNFTLTLGKTLVSSWPQDIVLTGSTALSFPASFKQFEFTDATLEHKAFRLEGNACVKPDARSAFLSGKVSGTSSTPGSTLRAFGLSQTEDFPFRSVKFETGYAVSQNDIELSQLSGKLDSTDFSGNIKHSWQGRPRTDGALHLKNLNLDTCLSNQKTAKETHARLPLSLLREHDARILLTLDKLRAFETTLTKLAFPITLAKGRLHIPVTALFPGGGKLTLDFTAASVQNGNSVDNSANVRVTALNLLAFCKDRGQKTLLDGTGTLNAALTSRQVYWDDWKRTLNGELFFSATNGAVISTNGPSGQKSGESRTAFKTLSLSTQASNGIVTSKDFRLEGNLTSVKGAGTINLQEQSIDASAKITLAGIPEMPVTIKGPLTHPTTNYQVVGAVVGTVGNIGSTAIDLLGFVLTSPFRLFSGNKGLQPAKTK
ncbi:AsmA-like C-terminal region-containing protein [uncultured Mailhella sp.]|uniref:AsmA-like C-terminal region-containing protein n=1 Tax=uncultured Mailhella sp. TaxID=1981031 RepID=UPI002612FE39|nr:AsmA-like C-terminal region-containing protein [uncultured Mailhella sp.]